MKAAAPSPKVESRPQPKLAPKPAKLKKEVLPTPSKPSVPPLPAFVRAGLGQVQTPTLPPALSMPRPDVPLLANKLPEPPPGSGEAVAAHAPPVSSPAAATSPVGRPPDHAAPPLRSVVTHRKQGISPSGQAMLPHVQEAIENSLGISLEGVQIHADSHAQAAASLFSARAFTYGNHIFLGRNETIADLKLIAHEAAHVVQQQGVPTIHRWAPGQSDAFEREADRASTAVARGERFTVSERVSTPRIQRWGFSSILNKFAEWANVIPGFRMFTIVLGVNPVNMSPVERSAANIMRAVVEFIPGGGLITQALDKYGVFDKVGNWVEQQIRTLGLVGSSIKKAADDFINSLHWSDIGDLDGVWERAKKIFTDPIDRIKKFVSGLVDGIIKFIKDAILMPLAKLAEGTRGWDLLIAVLGKNPITNEPVPQTAETLIGGFMKLIGEEEVWDNIQKAKAIPRAWAWFKGALAGLLAFVSQVPTLFLDALKSLVIEDIVILPNAFIKVGKAFGTFLGKFLTWAGDSVWTLLQIIFEVVAPGAIPYLKKLGASFKLILKNPIGFVGNLVKAGKLGFQQFADNIGAHLKASFIEWLTGSLTGVYLPQSLEFREIVKFVLSVLGLTWQNIRGKLVKVVGETAVKAMETGFDIVVTLVTEGPAAAWEKIKEQLSNLKDMVMQGIMDFIIETVVKKAVAKVLSLLVPGGAFLQAIISIYDTIMVFIDKLAKIIQVAKAFLDSMMDIASGAIGGAAKKVESTLAGLLTLAISFLAGFLGLGKIADKVLTIIQKIRDPIDKAMDKVIDWIVTMAKKLFAKVFGKEEKPDDRTDAQKAADLDSAMAEAKKLADDPEADAQGSGAKFPAIQKKYRLKALHLDPEANGKFEVVGEINPVTKIEVELAPGDIGTKINPGPVSATLGGTMMEANPLTPKHDTGSAPSSSPGVWDKVKPDALRRDGVGLYVRGHLLNQQLGGKGSEENLTPITYSANSNHLHSVEKILKEMVNAPKKKQALVYYKVEVTAPSRAAAPSKVIPEEKQLTRGLKWQWHKLKATGDPKKPKLEALPEGDSGFVENVPDWPHV